MENKIEDLSNKIGKVLDLIENAKDDLPLPILYEIENTLRD